MDEIGIPIKNLEGKSAAITSRGIAVVEKHLSRFEYSSENEGMIQRLKDISAGKLQATQSDMNFYTHELREYVRYRNLGYEFGQPLTIDEQYRLWNNLHTGTLEDYKLKEGPGILYHPSVELK